MEMKYCPFCGSQLMKNAKFCSQCGKPVSNVQEAETQEEKMVQQTLDAVDALEAPALSPKHDAPYTFKIGTYDLQITESVIAYNKVRTRFVDHAEQSRNEFELLYDNEVHDFEALYDKALPAVIEASTDAIPFAVSVLGQYGLTMKAEEFAQLMKDNIRLNVDLQEYIDLAEQLSDFTQELSSYRAANRSRSIQWQGGGFGLKGAISGALMAGALNLATDAVRGVGHAVVDSADRARLKKLEIDIYKSRDHKKHLGEVLYSFYISLFEVVFRLLEEKKLIVYPPFDIEAGIGPITEAFDLIDNPYASKADYEKALKLTLQGMSYDPYFPLSYLTLYKIPLVSNADVLKTVKFFGVEDNFAPKVIEYETDGWNNFKAIPEDSVEKLNRKIEKGKKLNSECLYVHISLCELEEKRDEIVKKAEEQAAKHAKELQRQEENSKLFLRIKELPEQNLEQLHTKYNQLVELTATPEITQEINRIDQKLKQLTEQEQRVKEQSDFLAAFANISLRTENIARELVKNVVFQSLYTKINRNLDETKEMLRKAYFRDNRECRVILRGESVPYVSALQNIRERFAPYSQTEIPIIYIQGVNGSNSGLLMSNQKVYIRGDLKEDIPYAFPLNEIHSISATKRQWKALGSDMTAWKISINGTPSFERFEDDFLRQLTIDKLVQILYFVKNYCLFLVATEGSNTDTFANDVLTAAGMKQNQFACGCNSSNQSEIDKIKQEMEKAKESIATNNERDFVKKIKEGNICYCFALDTYYSDLVYDADPDDGKDHFDQVKQIISEINKYKNIHPFFELLEAYLWERYCTRNHKDVSRYVAQISKLSDQGLPAAMAIKGFWASNGYNNFKNMTKEGISLLEKASAADDPTAMAWLGMYYRSGSFGLPVDLVKAEKLLTRAAAYGQLYAIKELDALEKEGVGTPRINKTESSGCFITSAVCHTLKKPDDCYELTAFRAFRDTWLCKQPGGADLIKEYYKIAPPIVSEIDSRPDSASIYRSIWRKYLMPCLRYLESGQYEKCKRHYVSMVETLKFQYQ